MYKKHFSSTMNFVRDFLKIERAIKMETLLRFKWHQKDDPWYLPLNFTEMNRRKYLWRHVFKTMVDLLLLKM